MIAALPLLIERAKQARDQLAAAARQATLAVQQAQAVRAQLETFRQDTLARSPLQGTRHFSADQLVDWQRFMARLDQALESQQAECERRRQHEAWRLQQVAEGQRRLTAFEALATREAQARAQRLQRAQQREADAFAARAFRTHSVLES